ncbi:MAG: hypothetical protein RIQ56_269 [Candidatus Parcubacteria bacterium]|jgi:subtilisin family serine protease
MNERKDFFFLVFVLLLLVGFGKFVVEYERPQKVVIGREGLHASAGRSLDASKTQILVKFKGSASPEKRSRVHAAHGLRPIQEIPGIDVMIVSVPEGANPRHVVDALNQNESDSIEFAEPDMILEPTMVPNDAWYTNWQKDKEQINAPAAWDITTGSSAIVLAVVDSGVNCQHEDLSGTCVPGWNFYDNSGETADVHGHGTAVAGVAAALGNNAVGVTGVAWQSKIMPLRVSDSSGRATYSAIASAISYAANAGAKVANVSYQAGGSSAVQRAASYLRSKGGLVVMSEGNSGTSTGYKNATDIISVSAVDTADVRYSWSSYGADVDVAAPGCTGATTYFGGGYGTFCGTSNAAPEVAGTLLLIWSANPDFSPEQVQNVLYNSASDLGAQGWDQYYGWGRVDVARALALSGQFGSTPAATTTTEQPKKNPRSR